MPVYQINVWVCEVCGKVLSTIKEASPYSDPVVVPPNYIEWEYVGEPPNEKLACPECYAKSKAG
jgi:rubrerythrin